MRPLTEFANRSPMHAFAVWLLKSALIGLLVVGLWLVVVNWAVPTMVEGLSP
jgi:hypothetical protein